VFYLQIYGDQANKNIYDKSMTICLFLYCKNKEQTVYNLEHLAAIIP